MVTPRCLDAELLDGSNHDPVELAASLAQVAQVNRWPGGVRSLRSYLRPVLQSPSVARVLDVGTGNGDTLGAVQRWASNDAVTWTGVGVDNHPQIARIARDRHPDSLRILVGDALRLPFADDSFDVSLTILTLHHFTGEDAVQLLREMARVTRKLVLVSDLERCRLNYWGACVLSSTVWRTNRLTRNDGPLSVLRSFTPDELQHLGQEAGLANARVRRHHPFRLVLSGCPA